MGGWAGWAGEPHAARRVHQGLHLDEFGEFGLGDVGRVLSPMRLHRVDLESEGGRLEPGLPPIAPGDVHAVAHDHPVGANAVARDAERLGELRPRLGVFEAVGEEQPLAHALRHFAEVHDGLRERTGHAAGGCHPCVARGAADSAADGAAAEGAVASSAAARARRLKCGDQECGGSIVAARTPRTRPA